MTVAEWEASPYKISDDGVRRLSLPESTVFINPNPGKKSAYKALFSSEVRLHNVEKVEEFGDYTVVTFKYSFVYWCENNHTELTPEQLLQILNPGQAKLW